MCLQTFKHKWYLTKICTFISVNKKPLILAHRGLVNNYQENTLAALNAAIINPYCNGVELDIHLTKDFVPVLIHDKNLKRLTSNNLSIFNLTYQEVKSLNINYKIKTGKGITTYKKEEKIPRLVDFLDLLKNKDAFVDFEIKTTMPESFRKKTGKIISKLMKEFKIPKEQFVCSSYGPLTLRSFKQFRNELTIAPILSQLWAKYLIESDFIKSFVKYETAFIELPLITKKTVAKYRKNNMKIGTFTLFPLGCENNNILLNKHINELKRMVELEVDYLITDQPDLLSKHI